MKQRWGGQREFIFDSLGNLMIARIDFKLYAYSEVVPQQFELEELNGSNRTGCTLLQWRRVQRS